MAITNNERVGKALTVAAAGLSPFVDAQMRGEFGTNWPLAVADDPSFRPPANAKSDIQFLLKALLKHWETCFRDVLGKNERNWVFELRDVRNKWAHQEAFTSDDAYRALDTAHRLLAAVAAGEQAQELDRMKHELLRSRYAEEARQVRRRSTASAIEGQPAAGLRPWREVVTPHPDVASGRYQQAEFAADLHAVWRDEAEDEYGRPEEFFRRTFLTQGLRDLLLNSARRLRGDGGDPIVELQTNFGGGKTHSLIALYHLAGGYPPATLPGVEQMLANADVKAPPRANVAVLVGQMLSPSTVHEKPDGTHVRTLWGELAWQLGGADGYAVVADADAAGTSPGEALIRLVERYAPCLILIDEWVAYARQLYAKEGLPAGSFDAQFTFAQALCDAARRVPNALLVVSIPASDIEVGGEGGRAALERLKNVVGRMEASWKPASPEEGFEIVRRRLFEEVAPELARERDAVVKAFGSLYRSQAAEFPPECREADYERRLVSAYPIHPELFDRLYGEWSTLEKFQRTRGVLRLMAAVIHSLWERGDGSLLIMPGTLPIDATAAQAELTRYLEDGWTPVIETDVDGDNALPLRLDRENPALGRYSATRRVARTVFLGSAPVPEAANRGVDDRRIKLGCVQPGEGPATFGDALRRLGGQAMYLNTDGNRYWYSLQQTLARLAADRAQTAYSDDDADEEVRRRLRAVRDRGDFMAVHWAPRFASDVADDAEARLVVLGPEAARLSKEDEDPARKAAEEILAQRAAGQRRYRNMLVFLAPDATRLAELRQAARLFLAWKSIDEDQETLNLDALGRRQAETKRAELDDTVVQRISETYVWVLVPRGTPTDAGVGWDELRVTGADPLPTRVSKRLRTDELLLIDLGGVRLRHELDRIPLWRGDDVSTRQLWEDFAQYLYLPRLRESSLLATAIAEGAAQITWEQDTFAYADGKDEAGARYLGLVAGGHAIARIDSQSLVVRSEVARVQLDSEASVTVSTTGSDSTQEAASNGFDEELPAHDGRPRRFHGSAALNALRMTRDADGIAEAVVQHLAALEGAEVTVTIQIDAQIPDGVPDNVVRTVTENAVTLKFSHHEFEDE